MHLGRVTGTLVATAQYEGLQGIKFLLVQPLDRQQKPDGDMVVCCDGTGQAGPDELIYFIGGREAALVLEETFVPVDHTIVGIVDAAEDTMILPQLPKKNGKS
ncbi:MAG: EutN/CcmL family microcompartment protein [Candidatus Eisenbacteria bacterium]|uniref:EutN/CcmL family microcompartment protein n=1 Tax=Eiseniibacteriota bacterium TaxID=2212470 RepID=A0A7Y2EAA4_UNCEI|nr:EutN/CcmL family microcompartment protein [Candidatus Eisenbacteria bacterium]